MCKAWLRRFYLNSATFGAGILVLAGCGAPDDSSLKVVGGQVVALSEVAEGKVVDDSFNASNYVAFVRTGMDGSGCSGTFVDIPGADKDAAYVLTASHCVDPVSMTVKVIHKYTEQIEKKAPVEKSKKEDDEKEKTKKAAKTTETVIV